ncbi:unnamed protein product [Trichobilharzia regenti]|nr:unnamed protein product [Trichobilharzia regenti]
MEQAVQANQGLSQDVARLTLAWRHAAQQLDKRESEWREEESAFNDYFAAEHSRLLSLWRAVVALRRQFADLRQQTDKDLTNMYRQSHGVATGLPLGEILSGLFLENLENGLLSTCNKLSEFLLL